MKVEHTDAACGEMPNEGDVPEGRSPHVFRHQVSGCTVPEPLNERIFFCASSYRQELQHLFFLLSLSVQLCGSNPGSTRNDHQAAGAGDGMQNHGQGQRLHERQEEGTKSVSMTSSSLYAQLCLDEPTN